MGNADKSRIWNHSICCARLCTSWNNDHIETLVSLTCARLKVREKKATAFLLADLLSFANNLLNVPPAPKAAARERRAPLLLRLEVSVCVEPP